jgi:hypothetical protein
MQVFLEIDKRIDAARALLALEELHLERVRKAGLDFSTALDLVINQKRHVDCLISQRARVVAHQGIPRRGLNRSTSTHAVS